MPQVSVSNLPVGDVAAEFTVNLCRNDVGGVDLPAKLAIPLRVIASIVAISAQLDAHVPVRALAEQLIPGFADPRPVH